MWFIIYTAICYSGICCIKLVAIYTMFNTTKAGCLLFKVSFCKCCEMEFILKVICTNCRSYVCVCFNCKNVGRFDYSVSYRLKTSVFGTPVVLNSSASSVVIAEFCILEGSSKGGPSAAAARAPSGAGSIERRQPPS